MSIATFPFDSAEFLLSDEEIAYFAEATLEDGDPNMFRSAIDVIARAYGFARLADLSSTPRRELIEALRDPAANREYLLRAVLRSAGARVGREAAE